MFKLLCFLAFLTPSLSFADPGWSQVTQVENGPIVKIEKIRGGGTCTATVISDEGHMLTARHCFNGCIIQNETTSTRNLFPEYGYRSPKLYSPDYSSGITCDVLLDGNPSSVVLLTGSHSFMIPSEQGSLGMYDADMYYEFLESNYMHNGDFVIIQSSAPLNRSCLQIEDKNPLRIGSDVLYYGYPSASTGRPAGRNSDGNSLLRSQGFVSPTIQDNSCISSPASEGTVRRYDREEIVLSTVDIIPGASGSSLLNTNLKVVSLLNSSYYSGDNNFYQHYCSGSAVGVSIESVLEQAVLSNPGFQISDLSCTHNKTDFVQQGAPPIL